MKKYLLHVTLVAVAAVSVMSTEYVRIADERERLLGQLREAASVVSNSPPESAEATAAKERGTLIAVGWPCHWWENREAVRSEAARYFDALIAANRANKPESQSGAESDQPSAKR